jgi:hypothetical protein
MQSWVHTVEVGDNAPPFFRGKSPKLYAPVGETPNRIAQTTQYARNRRITAPDRLHEVSGSHRPLLPDPLEQEDEEDCLGGLSRSDRLCTRFLIYHVAQALPEFGAEFSRYDRDFRSPLSRDGQAPKNIRSQGLFGKPPFILEGSVGDAGICEHE